VGLPLVLGRVAATPGIPERPTLAPTASGTPTPTTWPTPRYEMLCISERLDGAPADGPSYAPDLSADGERVVFVSAAENLVDTQTYTGEDLFLRNVSAGILRCLSLCSDGGAADGPTLRGALSANGQMVAMESRASNLVVGDHNNAVDIFSLDLGSGGIQRRNLRPGGQEPSFGASRPALDGSGALLAYDSMDGQLDAGDENGASDVFIHSLADGASERISVPASGGQADGASVRAALSADGAQIVFQSEAGNLAPGDVNGLTDIYLSDRSLATTMRVSFGLNGSEPDGACYAPDISADGRWVLFSSAASNLVPNDHNGVVDLFVLDRVTEEMRRVNVSSSGAEADLASGTGAISGDGRFVAYASRATNLASGADGRSQIYRSDLQTGQTICLTCGHGDGTGDSHSPAVSSDGRTIVFVSEGLMGGDADESGDSDVYLWRELF